MPSSPFDHYALSADTDSAESASLPSVSKSASSSPYHHSRSLMDTADTLSRQQRLQPLALFPAGDSGAAAAGGSGSDGGSAVLHSFPASSQSDSHCDAASDASSLSIPPSLTNSTSASAASTASTSSSSASSPPVSRDRLIRVKDKLKHSESENRRRTRLRHKFSLLRDAAGCSKKDRYTILTTACSRINELHGRLQQTEHDKASLLLTINNITQLQQQQQQQSGSRLHASFPSSLPSLSSYPLLSSVCAALVSVDGRVLDCNGALCAAVGAGRDELTAHTMFALCDSKQLLDSVMIMKRLIEGQSDTWEMTRTLLHRAGHATEMQCTLASVRHEGRLAAFLLLMVPAVQQQQQYQPQQQQMTSDGLTDLQHEKLIGWQQSVDGGCGDEFVKREDATPPQALLQHHFHASLTGDGGYGEQQQVQSFISNNSATQHSPSFSATGATAPITSSYSNTPLPAGPAQDALSGSVISIKQEAEAAPTSSMQPPSPLAHIPHRALKRPHPYLTHHLQSHERPAASLSPSYDSNTTSSMPPPRPHQATLHGSSQPSLSRRLPPSMSITTSAQPLNTHYSPAASHGRHMSSSSSSSTQLLPSHHAMPLSHSLSAGVTEPRMWGRPSLSAPNSPTNHQPSNGHSHLRHVHHPHLQQQQQPEYQQQHYHSSSMVDPLSMQPRWSGSPDGGSSNVEGRDEDALVAGGPDSLHPSFNSFLNMPC